MASVSIQSLSSTTGNTAGGYSVTLTGTLSNISSLGPQLAITAAGAHIVAGKTYIISALGNSLTSDWIAIGLNPAVIPAIGVTFTGSATTGSGSGTGMVENVFPTVYSVLFGSTPATNVVVLNNNQITCVVPAVTQGVVNVTVTDVTDSISFTLSNAFTFLNVGQTTLGTIRQQIRERADMVNSSFISDSEFNSYINSSYKELYDILTQKFGDDYFVATPYTYTTQTNGSLYPLPVDFYKLMGVEIALNTGNPASWVTLKKFEFIDRNKWSYPNIYTFYGITNLRYRINGTNLMIAPIGQAGQTIRIWYNPRLAQLINDGDIVDGVSGWEEYIIADACIKAWTKQESDPTVFGMQKAALLKRIEEAAENRDVGEASHVSDSKSLNYFGNGNDGSGQGFGSAGY